MLWLEKYVSLDEEGTSKAYKSVKGGGESKKDKFRAYLLFELPPSKSSWFYLLHNQNPLNKMFFISSEKLFSFLRYLQFFPDSFGHIGKQLDKKSKVNFKIYDVTNWNTKNYNKHIVRYFKK